MEQDDQDPDPMETRDDSKEDAKTNALIEQYEEQEQKATQLAKKLKKMLSTDCYDSHLHNEASNAGKSIREYVTDQYKKYIERAKIMTDKMQELYHTLIDSHQPEDEVPPKLSDKAEAELHRYAKRQRTEYFAKYDNSDTDDKEEEEEEEEEVVILDREAVQEAKEHNTVKFKNRTYKVRVQPETGKKSYFEDDEDNAESTTTISALQPHQTDAVDHILKLLKQNTGALLAHAMGLGKTATALKIMQSYLDSMEHNRPLKFLLLAPLSVLKHWTTECKKWSFFNIVYLP